MAILGIMSFPLAALPEVTYSLNPSDTVLGFRAFILSIFPIQGDFRSFSGEIVLHRANLASCEVTVRVAVRSLWVHDAAIRESILAPRFLDPKADPFMRYDGHCVQGGLAGTLTLHGQTHPFDMRVIWAAHDIVARGALSRAKWAIVAEPFLAGPIVDIEIRIHNAVPFPHPNPSGINNETHGARSLRTSGTQQRLFGQGH